MFELNSVPKAKENYKATQNACILCSPLGASVAYKGFKGCVPLIHGSQGCATYIRRYLISHYKEPIDIASSNFTEDATIFGGDENFKLAVLNIINQYKPEIIGIASTCLSETIGDDVSLFLHHFLEKHPEIDTDFVMASTPSYQGTHIDGFHEAVSSVVKHYAKKGLSQEHLNLFPGFVSTEDLRLLKEIMADFSLEHIMMPDYSESLDNPVWDTYHRIPEGGTAKEDVVKSGSAKASIEFGTILNKGKLSGRVKSKQLSNTGAQFLKNEMDVPLVNIPMPIGITQTDAFFEELKNLSGNEIPEKYSKQRGRLVDAYVDAHKYTFGKRAVVYGEEDFVVAMAAFLDEIGIELALVATGGESGMLENEIKKYCPENKDKVVVREGYDFESIREWSLENKPDILIGHSKGYYIARELNIPIVRVGFPVHDRVGGQRIKHLGYSGTQELFDKVVNALIEHKQSISPVGYKYM
ncbi:nitrogenase component 1 [Draconibacterium sediminis]|uniref:nitrogenase component 1 n=1 Tax=Draconibacterium sediminis TaxID=1544798 RepID=UPI0026EED790|nr:nitrogenase component 1 [Draconibacterium sediminis]